MEKNPEEERFLAVAASISDGNSVNWEEVTRQTTDPDDTAIVEQLRILDGIARAHADLTNWGSLTVVEDIGHGSFATVYRAYDPDLQRYVALKVIRPRDDRPFEPDRAVDEARRLARVKHANVVTVYNATRKDELVGVSMELIQGQTLEQIVQGNGAFSAKEATLIGVDVCHALAAVHGAGLLHGDIKAHNVMRENGGRLVLMDFGAGRDLDAAAQAGNDFAGTPLYVAPEVFKGETRSRASDIYSLGVLLYYLASGRYPVDGDSRTQIDRQHQTGTSRQRLRDVRPDLPDAFIDVVERATAENQKERYESAGALSSALRASLGKRPAFPRWMQAAAAVIAIVAVAGIATYRTMRDRNAAPAATPAPAIAAPAATSSVPAADSEYRIEAALYRARPDGATRLSTNARIEPGDRLFFQVEASTPAHVYVVNEDDQGESYLLFPLPGQEGKNPLAANEPHRLPGVQNGEEMQWQVSSAGGREHFLIFVSPERLTRFEKTFAALPAPSQNQAVQSVALSVEGVSQLRAVGSLTPAPAGAGRSVRLSEQYTTPLGAAETTRGLWVRQVTVSNPK